MKATKIMGAVLGVLLVAALFTGAVAAVAADVQPTDAELGNYYAYLLVDDDTWDINVGGTTWTLVGDADKTVTFVPDPKKPTMFYVSGKNLVEGKYAYATGTVVYYLNIKQPTTAIVATAWNTEGKPSEVIGSTVDTDKLLNLSVADSALGSDVLAKVDLYYTNPKGTLSSYDFSAFSAKKLDDGDYAGNWSITSIDAGLWTVQAAFLKENVKDYFASTMPTVVLGKEYYFTVIKADDTKKIEALSNSVIQGDYVTLKVTAPEGEYEFSLLEHASVPAGQPFVIYENKEATKIKVPGSQEMTFFVKADDSNDLKVEINFDGSKKSVTVKVTAATITATADVESIYIGNEFDLEGTNDLGGDLFFYIKGTNYKLTPIDTVAKGGAEWEATIKTAELMCGDKKPDAGTYTIYVVAPAADVDITAIEDVDDLDGDDVIAYTTVSIALKQPFITITSAPEVVIQGDKLKVVGTAEGEPSDVKAYIFGTNFFINKTVSVDDGEFTVEIELAKKLEIPVNQNKPYLAAGQYFLVIQHPMYDGKFNIASYGTKFYLNETGDGAEKGDGTELFDTNVRQSSNAAKALCDELDAQKIDDMYVKASFIVASPDSFIDPIPSKITKGQVLTVSGSTNGHKNDVVVVELLSTAFAAMPKEAVGSASFVALSTKIGDDGVWSISFDTSNLNADEYTCSVAVGSLEATTAKITIVEGTGPQPTQTTGPVTPTAQPTAQPSQTPATPGFGALAALAGLGAVAVLLLRRE